MKPSTQPRFTAAVIGLGFVGVGDQVSGDAIGQKVVHLDGTHAQALAGHPRVKLVAGASRDEGRRQRFAARFDVRGTYADWREMLARERPDIVSVATNSPYHAEITLGCVEAGARAVFCEKPIATRLSDADRAIAACASRGVLLAVNHNRRWSPLWRMAREKIRQGTLGEVYQVSVHWPSGRLGNVGTHLFDAARLLIGGEPQAVSGTLDPLLLPDCRGSRYRDPGGWGVVAFGGGVKLFVNAPQAAKLPLAARVLGSLGELSIRRDEAVVELHGGGSRTLAAPKDSPSSVALAVDDIVNCLTRGGRPASTGEDARAALEIVVGFHVSDRNGARWTPLPLAGADRDLEVLIG